jgi:hypothetical protein
MHTGRKKVIALSKLLFTIAPAPSHQQGSIVVDVCGHIGLRGYDEVSL